MVDVGTDLTSFFIFFLVLLLTYVFVSWRKKCWGLPPGPQAFPLIGNMLQIRGRDLRHVCEEYRKTYGDIFTIHIFNHIVIVVNGYENIKDIFVKNGDKFSERHRIDIIPFKGQGIGMSTGEMWKHNRRFVVRTLKDFGMGKKRLQTVIHSEIQHFLELLEREQEKPFDIEHIISVAISNIICLVLFGERLEYKDDEALNIMDRFHEIFEVNLFMNPHWLRFIPGDPFKMERCLGHYKYFVEFYRTKIQQHYKDFDENNVRDVIDAYIKQMKAGETEGEKSLMNEDELAPILNDLYTAGTETTASTLIFTLICFLRHPEIQEKLYSELKTIVPDNRLPDIDDVKKLPYLQATVSEMLRRSSVVPFSLPHATKTDLQFRGYKIPKSAHIFPNLESVLYDGSLWNAPLNVSPDRFLEENSTLRKTEELIPFGVGPRICPGESMARMELYLFLSAIVQRFKFLSPEGEDPPSFVTALGITAKPFPFKLRAIQRM